MRVLERGPRGIDDKPAEDREHDHRLDPPPIVPVGFAEPTRYELDGHRLHSSSPCLAHCTIASAACPHSFATVRYRRTTSLPTTYGCFSPGLRAAIAGSFVLLPS